jgi:hypothetical protein
MLTLILMFALATSTTPTGQCPPAGFEHVAYVTADDATALAAEVQRQIGGSQIWNGPAGLEARPDAVNLDLYVGPDGKVAAICVISGERHVIAAVSKSLGYVKLHPGRPVILPLCANLVWRSESRSAGYGDLTAEFTSYDLKVSTAARP